MKAIRLTQTGGPEQLVMRDYPTPTAGPGEVLVRVHAAGLNYIDVYQRTGFYSLPFPVALGLEGAGAVEAVGASVGDLHVGDRVAWVSVPGSYATHAVIPAERAVKLPEAIDSRTAAAIMLQGLTAHFLTRSTFVLREGHTALVHAAAGGVGLLLVQMARQAGARVLATVSTPSKAALAREAGAHEVIIYTQQDFADEVRRMTGGAGVDVVYDAVGKTTFERSLQALAPRGCLVLYGQASGPVPAIEPAILAKSSLYLTRPTLGHYVATRQALLERAHELFAWITSGAVKVRIDHAYPLADAAEAHRALEGRATTGKVLLIPE